MSWKRSADAPRQDPNRIARELFDGLPDRYDRLAEVLSFGQNGRWRRAMVERITPTDPGRCLDVASGTAGVAIQLARGTSAHVIGLDLTEEMVRRGQRNVTAAGLGDRVALTIGKAEQLAFSDGVFDALTFTYLLRYVADPQEALNELARVVRQGGVVASLEFFVPPSRFWWLWWWLFTRFMLPAAGWVTGRAAHSALARKPATVEYFAADGLQGGLEVREGGADERFVPFGRRRSMRLRDFLAKQRVSGRSRKHPTVLADAEGILWVVGVRRAARAPVTERTPRALRVLTERHD